MRLKHVLCRLHARQPPWMPKPASGADAAAWVALAWAWRLGPCGGCGKRGCGAGQKDAFRDLGIAQRWAAHASAVWPRYAAWFEAGLLAESPGRAMPLPGRAPPPDPVPVAGAPRVRRRERARTRPRKSETSRHGTRIGSVLGVGADSAGSDDRKSIILYVHLKWNRVLNVIVVYVQGELEKLGQ
jgi:hypothetical protein